VLLFSAAACAKTVRLAACRFVAVRARAGGFSSGIFALPWPTLAASGSFTSGLSSDTAK
jgi:hypothetical protein